MPIRKGHILPIRRNPKAGGGLFLPNSKRPFCQSGGVSNRRGPFSCQSGRVTILPTRKDPNSEGSCFLPIWKSHILPIRRGPNSEESATSTLDREKKSELSDFSIDKLAARGSPTENIAMHVLTVKAATSSSFSNELKQFGKILSVYYGNGN